jgi:hypothetical protein
MSHEQHNDSDNREIFFPIFLVCLFSSLNILFLLSNISMYLFNKNKQKHEVSCQTDFEMYETNIIVIHPDDHLDIVTAV